MSVVPGKGVHVHKVIRAAAIDMAEAVYDGLMKKNQWYDWWKARNPDVANSPERLMLRFVHAHWPTLIEDARRTLAGMLATDIKDDLKVVIHDALIKDAKVRPARLAAMRPKTVHLKASDLGLDN